MKNETKKQVIADELLKFGVVPNFPAINATNEAEGVDGDCLCPFRAMHTTEDADPNQPTTRIWLDKANPTKPEDSPKIFLSCRHTSCQELLWHDITLPVRKKIDGGRVSRPLKKGQRLHTSKKEVDPMLKKKAEAALMGKQFVEELLNNPESLGTTEETIMALSPLKITPAGATSNPFAQASFLLSLLPEHVLFWMGDPDSAKSKSAIRTIKEWMEHMDSLQKSPACQEAPEVWPWPGRLITGSSYKTKDGGRNLENQDRRFFTICEADKMTKKDQLRVIRAMISDKKRFRVAYVLYSGSKSYHIGLSASEPTPLDLSFLAGIPGTQVPKEFVSTKRPTRFGGMGFDHMTTGAVQPARFPGPVHPKTGKPQRLLYIDPSLGYDCL